MSNQEREEEKPEGLKTYNIKGVITIAKTEMRQNKNTL